MNSDYDTYREWKKWGKQDALKGWQCRYFAKEVKRANLKSFASLLEVGFGNGEFLRWAKDQGVQVCGIEIIPELVDVAKSNDIEAYLYDLFEKQENDPLEGRKFDCIVAFDVLEHMTVEQAKTVFIRLAEFLTPDGKIIFRFPNGESPFYVPIQNGDYTHRMDLCAVKLKHLCIGTGLQLEQYANAARVAAKPSTAWLKWILFKLRDLTELYIGALYYNKRRPLDPVATAILSKTN